MNADMSLAAVRVFVSDIQGASCFYRDHIGLAPALTGLEDGFVVFTLANGVDLILEEDTPQDDDESLVGRFLGVSLAVRDIEATCDALSALGVRFVQTPEIQSWGGILAHFLDPDDNVLTLVQLPQGEAAAGP